MAIRITPEEIDDLAGKLSTNATETESLAAAITGNFENGTANFEGNTANRYREAFNELIPIMSTKMPQLLLELADELRRTANAFRELDN